jgi:hypothetical protein
MLSVVLQCIQKQNETTKRFLKKSSLTKILIDWVRLFHDINLKNNGAIVIPRFSTICGFVWTSFGDIDGIKICDRFGQFFKKIRQKEDSIRSRGQ